MNAALPRAMRVLLAHADGHEASALGERLRTAGFDVLPVSQEAALAVARGEAWDCAVTGPCLGPLAGEALLKALDPLGRPVFLFASDKIMPEDPAIARGVGYVRSFHRLQRLDLLAELARLEAGRSKGRTFLVVEDSPTVRNFVTRVLEDRYPGSLVLQADDGKAALAAMKSHRVNLIVSDLQMPGMDGMSFLQMLRNNPVLQKKPVIILSGMVTPQLRAELSSLPHVLVLSKPASPDSLAASVAALVG